MNRSNTAAVKTIAAKTTKVSRAVPHEDNKPEVAGDEGVFAEAMKRYQEAQEGLLKFFSAPSWKRTLCAFVTTIVVSCGIGYLAGQLLGWMVVGAVAMAVPMFLIVLAWVLGAVLAIYYGGKLAARIGGAVLTGEADERAIAAYDAVKSFASRMNPFGKRTVVAAKAA